MTPDEYAAWQKSRGDPNAAPPPVLTQGDDRSALERGLSTAKDWGQTAAEGGTAGMTFGLSNLLGDKIFGPEAREIREINYPKTAMISRGIGSLVPQAGIAKGVAALGAKYGSPLIQKVLSGVGYGGGAGNAAVSSGVHGGVREGVDSVAQDRPYNFFAPLKEALWGLGLGGATGGMFSRTTPNVIKNELGTNAPKSMPGSFKDPTGTISDQPVTGPESLKLAGRGEEAAIAERLRQNARTAAEKKGSELPPSRGTDARDPAIKVGQERLDDAALDAGFKAAAGDEMGKRLPGWDALAPSSWKIRDELSKAAGLPSTAHLSGAKDSTQHVLEVLDRMKAQKATLPPGSAEAAQIDKDIATITNRISQPGKAPDTMAAKAADEAAAGYGKTWSDLGVTPAGPKTSTAAAIALPFAGAKVGGMIGMPGFGASVGQAIGSKIPSSGLPMFANPAKIAGILEDPAALSSAMDPPTLLRLLQSNALPAAWNETTKGFAEGIAGTGQRRRRGAPKFD